jgi:TonB-linked SusC/RagA family outer membrane protein
LLAFFACLPLHVFPQSSLHTSAPPASTGKGKSTLLEALIELNKARGVYFLFAQQAFGKLVVGPFVNSPNATVEKMLTQLLRNTGLYFRKVDDQTYVILDRKNRNRPDHSDGASPAEDSVGFGTAVPATDAVTGMVTGRVIAAGGRPLEGVSITVRRTQRGTATDAAGVFQINADKEDSLQFSMVGYKTLRIPAWKIDKGGVAMETSNDPLTEVLVTAMGIRKQERALGYSATDLDGSRFTDSREVNLGNALIGQAAGVSVEQNATGPFGSSRVLIRGNASLSGNNQPLYVIDGVPYDNTTQSFAGQYGGFDLGDGLSNINPDDIAKILILKGVAASSLYGYRGGNGAILITTKSGLNTHGIGVQVNNNITGNSVIDERDYQYMYGQGLSGIKPVNTEMALAAPYYSWGARLDGSPAVNYLGDSYAYKPARDNFRNFFRTGFTDQSSVALTGANSKGHFRLGLSDLLLNAIVPSSFMRQQGINLNSTYAVTDKLQLILTAEYVFEHIQNRASLSDDPGNVLAPPMYLANSFDIRWMKDHTVNPNGTEWLPGTTDPYFENPYYIANDYLNTSDRNRLTGGLTLKYNLLDWLFLQGQVTRDSYAFDVSEIVPSGVEYTRSDGVHGGNLTQYELDFHELNSSFMAGLHKKYASSFALDADLGVNEQDNITTVAGIGAVPNSGNRAAGPFIVAGNYNANNIAIKPYSSSDQHYRVNSIYGSVEGSYRNYLFLSLTARNDWFSTLSVHSDHYLYPSLSGSFIFSEAWRLPHWLSLGKLRASYAAASNGTAPYQNTLGYGVQGYTVSGQPLGYISTSYGTPTIPDAHLRPVSIREEEFGAYLRFLEDRLGFDVTVYNKLTTDDIVNVTVSPTSGYDQSIENLGRIRNRGVELLWTATPVKSRNFAWSTSFNFAVNYNKVLYIGGPNSIVINGAYPRWGSEVSISNVVGLPYGQILGYAYKRNQRGSIVYSDGVSNPTPAGEPEQTGVVPLGSTVYKQSGGFSNEFHYRNFTLSALFDFKFGAKLYSGTNLLLYYYGLQKTTLQGRGEGYVGKGVLENGHPNSYAVPAQQYFQDISAGGTDHIAEEFVYDASFIKWRSASLNYAFPAAMLKGKFIKAVNFSLVGRNLAILMKHIPNVDPESSINNTNGQGLELTGYPATRSWGLNINAKF